MFAGDSLDDSIERALAVLRDWPGHEEVSDTLAHARELAAEDAPSAEMVESLGAGWVAEEALAIAVYCSLVADDLAGGVLLAVNHSGDSDSTGAIVGNILGTMWGQEAVPEDWLDRLEGRDVIEALATDLASAFIEEVRIDLVRYPPW